MPVKKEKTSTADRELGISRLVNAPRDLVWEVWTKPEHIKHWWGPGGFTNTISKMEVRPEGEWEFIMHGPDGTDYKNKHIYKEVAKPEKLVLEHVSGPRFLMTVTFEEKGNKTLVNIHSIFESAEQLQEVIKVFKADQGMRQNVDRMENYLAGQTAGSGYSPISIERTYNAPVEKVWKAITDKDQMKQWYFDLAGFKPEPGFEFQFYGENKKGDKYLHLCKVIDVVPYKKLSHSWRYDGFEGNSFVSFELFKEGDKTRVRLTHAGLETFPVHNGDFAKENFEEGWTYIIGTSLKKFIES